MRSVDGEDCPQSKQQQSAAQNHDQRVHPALRHRRPFVDDMAKPNRRMDRGGHDKKEIKKRPADIALGAVKNLCCGQPTLNRKQDKAEVNNDQRRQYHRCDALGEKKTSFHSLYYSVGRPENAARLSPAILSEGRSSTGQWRVQLP